MWNLRNCLVFGWSRLGDLSLINWLFPNAWGVAVSAVIAVITALAGWVHRLPPPQWIVLGLLSGILALLIVHISLWAIERFRRVSHKTADAQTPQPRSARQIVETSTDRYMTVYEALHYLSDESEWGIKTQLYIGENGWRKQALLEAPDQFKRLAEQGNIVAIGRLDGVGQHVEIPKTYWISATISPFSLQNQGISETTAAIPNADGIPVYKDVRILRQDVRRTWPASK